MDLSMNVLMKIVLAAFLLFPINVHAQQTGRFDYVNPVYKDLHQNNLPAFKKAPTPKAPATECNSYADVKNVLKEHLDNRNTSFSFDMVYNFAFSNVESILTQAFDETTADDDYLAFSYSGYSMHWSGYNGDVTVNYSVTYLATASQEEYVTQRVSEILADIITGTMDESEKEKAIHDWIVSHVTYDLSLTRYSAYDALYSGTTVCQGYALLMYKMLMAVGIQTRIVSGDVASGGHAWNMVYLCGNWYQVDATWDDPVPDTGGISYNYYNLSDDELNADHTWIFEDYPAAPVSYVDGVCSNYTPPGTAPDTPIPSSPANGLTDVSLTPTLVTDSFTDPDPGDTHLQTEWRLSTASDFSILIYYNTASVNLTSMDLPEWVSIEQGKTYYWSVRFYDNHSNISEWSETFSFKTTSASPPSQPTPTTPAAVDSGSGGGCFVSSLFE